MKFALDENDKKLLELLSEGYSQSEIAHKIWKTRKYVANRLYCLRRAFHAYSNEHLLELTVDKPKSFG